MNTLQTLWSALTAPNPTLFKIITIPLTYLDAYIGMLFFSTILNIDIITITPLEAINTLDKLQKMCQNK